MHQVVTAQLAARRAGTQSTKTRAEVRGGGAKPWRQKGTGRARQGSSRAPHWVGGGVAHAPKPRSYAQKTPKKMMRLALRSALSDRAADGNGRRARRLGLRRPVHQERGRRPRRPRCRRVGSLLVLGEDDEAPGRASATCSTSTRSSPASSTPTTCWSPTGSCSPGAACPPRRSSPPRRRSPSRRTRRETRHEGSPRRHHRPDRVGEELRPPRRRRLHVQGRTRRPRSPRSTTPSRRSSG